MIKEGARDFFKEENFNEAHKSAHKCFQTETEAIRDPLRDILDDPKI
jgi:hypothetical protein